MPVVRVGGGCGIVTNRLQGLSTLQYKPTYRNKLNIIGKIIMIKDNAIGMFMGLFVGDALGAPLEFLRPHEIKGVHSEMTGGGVHSTEAGEWTDDGAMAVAIAEAYITSRCFDPAEIANNFKTWKKSGHFGTRDYVFDIGRTCSGAISRMTSEFPYAGSADTKASGNGSIMRLAPVMLANHDTVGMAIAEGVAVSLMTHGSPDVVRYTAAFIDECMTGKMYTNYNKLRSFNIRSSGRDNSGSIMHAYVQASQSCYMNTCFEDAVVHAVNKGYDADTVGAVTGMMAGAMYGYKSIPKRWLKALVKRDELLAMAEKLYDMGTVRVPPRMTEEMDGE
jgi:ADP-ribosyl-[dinitrogen reductase] hydrolase